MFQANDTYTLYFHNFVVGILEIKFHANSLLGRYEIQCVMSGDNRGGKLPFVKLTSLLK